MTTTPTYRTAASVNDTTFFQMQIGAFAGENTGVDAGYMSLEGRGGLFGDGGNSVFFLDGRLLLNEYQSAGANLGGGYRRFLSGPQMVLGTNAYFDTWNTGDHQFNQLGIGAELLGARNEFRSNVYAPIGTRTKQVGTAFGFAVDNDIFATRNLQTSLAGMDMEYGRLLRSNNNMDLKGFLGTYYYTGNAGVDDGLGVRVRGELGLGDSTKLNVSVQNDSIFDTTALFGVVFQMPGRGAARNNYRNPVYSRMLDRVERVQNVAVSTHTEVQATPFQAFFVTQNGTGTGVQVDPFSLNDLSNDPRFGEGDVAILLGNNGTITGNLVIDDLNQSVIGSANGDGNAFAVLPDGTIFQVSGLPGGRPTIDGQIEFQTQGFVGGLDFNSTADVPIIVDGLLAGQTVTIQDVNILGSSDDGIQILNTFGTVQFLAGTTGGLIDGVPGDGIQVNGAANLILDNATISNVGGNAIVTNYSGTFIGTGLTQIINPGANAFYLTNQNGSNFIFEDLDVTGGGNAIYMDVVADGYATNFSVTGTANFNNQVSTAITQWNPGDHTNNSNLSFGNLFIDQANGYGVALQNHDGSFNVNGAATIQSTGGLPISLGILSENSSTEFTFGSLDILNSGTAFALINHSGNVTVDNALTINDYNILGIQNENSTTNFNLGSLSVTNGGGTAVALTNHTGSFTVQDSAVIDTFNILGIQNSNSNTNWEFGSLSVGNTNGIGVALENNTGNFIVNNDAIFTNNRNGAFLARNNSSGDYSFGSLSASHTSAMLGYGVTLDAHTGSFTVDGDANFSTSGQYGLQVRNSTTDLSFGSLTAVGNSLYAVALENNSGDFTVAGDVNFTNPWQIGMLAINSDGDIDFGSLSVSNTAQYALALQNHQGDLTVRGNTTLTNPGGYGITSLGGSNGDLRFGSLDITGANFVGLNVEGGTGNVIVNNAATITNGNFGVQVLNRTGNVEFGDLSLSNQNTVGMTINNHTGDLTVKKNATFNHTGSSGALLTNINGDVNFNNLTAMNLNNEGVYVGNVTGDFNVKGDVNLTNAGTTGLLFNSLGGDVNINGNFNATGSNSMTALAVTQSDNAVNVKGNFNVDGAHTGIRLENTTTDLNLKNVNIQNTTSNGIAIANSVSNVTVSGNAAFTNTGANAIVSTNGSSGNFLFNTLDVEGNTANGVSLSGHTGDFTVKRLTEFNNTGGSAFNSTLSSGDYNFWEMVINGNTNNAIALNQHTGDFTVSRSAVYDSVGQNVFFSNFSTGDYSFGDIRFSNVSTTGIALNHHTGDFTVKGPTVLTNAGQIAFLSQDYSSGDYTFNGLNITGSSLTGIALNTHQGAFTANGNTSITGGNTGLHVIEGSGDITFGNLQLIEQNGTAISQYLSGRNMNFNGTTNITSPGASGLQLHTTWGSTVFNNLNVTNPGANGVSMVQHDGSLTINGGTISGIQSGQQGIFKHDSGGGSVSLNNMLFQSNANDLFGMVTVEFGNGGNLTLNNNRVVFANGSTGTIAYRTGSYGQAVNLSGTGNTSTNAVESFFNDTIGGLFNGQIEIDQVFVP